MKFTLSWLKQFLDTSTSAEEIGAALTDIGLELEDIIDKGAELKDFEVAEIMATEPHPSADRLRVCQVSTKDGMRQIVCGAPNARAGIKVVLAKVGVLIPNGQFKIKESEIRGVKSQGMMCSEEELLIGKDSNGIIELPHDAVIGGGIAKHYGLDDPVFDINVTPNRGDALGVYGIARDLAAKGLGNLENWHRRLFLAGASGSTAYAPHFQTLELFPNSPSPANSSISSVTENFTSDFDLRVKDEEQCPLFAVREISGLKNCQSPDWLKKLLVNIGLNPISAIVDVTNYICYSFGQPMHAYDKNKLSGGKLVIEQLENTANFTALNDKEYNLESGTLVIRDAEKIQCLAGVIGGKASACDEATSSIILEAACFDANAVSRSGRKYQINTDSRYRFERKIDQNFTLKALDIATNMIVAICSESAGNEGGAGVKISQIIMQGHGAVPLRKIEIQIDSFDPIIPWDQKVLEQLGFECEVKGNVVEVTIPSFRHDINIKEDLVEEIARINGYDKIPATALPDGNQGYEPVLSASQRRAFDSKRILANLSYDEVITWSFMHSQQAKLFTPLLQDDLFLISPISSELDYMRPSIIPNLLTAIAKNAARSVKNLSLFEIGPVFHGVEAKDEFMMASGVRYGQESLRNIHSGQREFDIFDIKADLAVLLSYMGLEIEKCKIEANAPQYYHPTRSASLMLGKNIIAHFGQIHPAILKAFNIENEVVAFELNLNNVPYPKPKFGRRDEFIASDFQIVTRDYAFVVDQAQAVGEILTYIKNLDKKLIRSVELFDIYMGDKIPAGTKSVALSVVAQANDRTLTEEDLKQLSDAIISGIEQKFGAKIRA